ncbi:hypothetical protein D3C73_552980 [compost metagenome]
MIFNNQHGVARRFPALDEDVGVFTIFYGICQQLPKNKPKPFAIREHRFDGKVKIKTDSFRDTPGFQRLNLFIQDRFKPDHLDIQIVAHERNPFLMKLLVQQMMNPQPFVH